MGKTSHVGLIGVLLVLGASACGDSALVDREFETREAVGGGTTDDANQYAFVPAIRAQGQDANGNPKGPSCSGFLATRRFVVSAAHCFVSPYPFSEPRTPTNRVPGA